MRGLGTLPNGDPVSFPRNGNKGPQDNAQAGKESPTVPATVPTGHAHTPGGGKGALWGAVHGGTKWLQQSPCKGGGGGNRDRNQTHGHGHRQPWALRPSDGSQGHCHAWPRPGLAVVSFGKKRWDERTVADESWDLPAKSHPALETILKSKGQQAHKWTTSHWRVPRGDGCGAPALRSSPLGHPAHCYHLTFH
uniref:Uncharacterized protein n=1 Tax=Myotis myotis TaxID=51298 RepID=A0A7J7XHM3_MYOMY|nr:hypothetical protein mMyoMyo1_011735 [Myotis myotis]